MLFVIIPTWNLKDELIACIASLLASSWQGQRIVVVDDASTDGTAEAVRQTFGETVDVIMNTENLGFTQTVNKGFDFALSAGAKWILLINNDTIVEVDMITHLMDAINQSPKAGVVSPIIYYFEPADRIWQIGDRQLFGPPLTWHVSEQKITSDALPVDYVTGCAMLIRRSVLETVGGFDHHYPMYFEDADFCQRVRKAGFDILVVPKAKMWHKVSLSTRNLAPKRIYNQARGRVIFLNRHSPHLLWPLANLYIWARLIIEGYQNIRRSRYDLFRIAFKGTLVGYQSLRQKR